jgi:hypothetical protein
MLARCRSPSVADPGTGGAGGSPLPPWATERTIFQKVKAKQWALAGEEAAMQSVTVVKEKRNHFGETTAARSEQLPRHALHPV